MADSQSLDSIRLALMQEVLPMGLAFVDRVRADGPAKAVESVARGDDPLGDLRQQGEAAAREVRERLDQISPGLGNPVMSVQVEVDEPGEHQDIRVRVLLLNQCCYHHFFDKIKREDKKNTAPPPPRQ